MGEQNIEKRGRGRPKGTGGIQRKDREYDATPAEISTTVLHMMELGRLPKIDRNNPEEVRERMWKYFECCAKWGDKPTVGGLCLALGVPGRTFLSWSTGERRAGEPDYQEIAQQARAIMLAFTEQFMADGRVNPVYGIFMLKNHFGYRDQTEVAVTAPNPLGEAESAESLQKKYLQNSGALPLEASETETET